MANISKIKFPNDSALYEIKDASAIASLSVDGTTITTVKRDGTQSTTEIVLPSDELTVDKINQMWNEIVGTAGDNRSSQVLSDDAPEYTVDGMIWIGEEE